MDSEKERNIFTEFPYHIAMLVKAAQKAIKEGHIRIENGQLVSNPPNAGSDKEKSKLVSDGE